MLKRIWIYLNETFKLPSRLLIAAVVYTGISAMFQALRGKPLSFTGQSVWTVAALVLILLYYRLSDEFKDRKTDEQFFGDRPLPSGRVLESDLKILTRVTVGLLLFIGVAQQTAVGAFSFMFGWAFLMRHWFFLEKYIAENRLLAFVTHAPISFAMNFYVVSVQAELLDCSPWHLDTLYPLLYFALPGFYWEIARKTFAPKEERAGYQTYSSMLGFRGAAASGLVLLLLEQILIVMLAARLDLSLPFLVGATLAFSAMAAINIAFMRSPTRFAPLLRNGSEYYTAVITAAVTAELLFAQGAF